MDEELKEMIEGFVEDCREGFESMEEDLMVMEENPDDSSAMNNLFRVMHTLKGTAGFMGLNDIQIFSHKLESVFDLLREKRLSMSSNLMDFLLLCIDKLKAMVFGQIGEQEIPDIQEEIGTLEKIIETCSDAILLKDGEAFDAPLPELETAARDESIPKELPVEEKQEDEIDFDMILAEHGENVPIPDSSDSAPEISSAPEIKIPPPPIPPEAGIATELLEQFVVEAEEHLELIEESLLALEENPDSKESINEFFRAIHSIKGTAGYVNLQQIEFLSHRIETIFDALRKGDVIYNKPMGDVIFKSIDMLRTMVFYIKNKDYVHSVDIAGQIKRLMAIPLDGVSEPLPQPPKTSASPPVLDQAEISKLTTFLASAQQQLEVLLVYQEEMQKGPLTEHDLITLHRSLKTLLSGARYCELIELEAALRQYEECLLRILEGVIEQTETIIREELQPNHQKVIEELEKIKTELENTPQSQSVQSASPPAVVEAVAPESEVLNEIVPEPDIIQSEVPAEPLPPTRVVETDSSNIDQQTEAVVADSPSVNEEVALVVSDTEKSQQRAARRVSNRVVEYKEEENASETKTMRVDASRLDRFMNLIGELIIARNAFKHLSDTINEEKNLSKTIQDIKLIENNISRISDNLQDNLMEMRLVQVKTVFQRMPRIVRDISRKTKKNISLNMVGETTEVDKSIVEEIGDPLVHIIRNSCDHGVETPEARVAAGKPEQGTITLSARHMGSFIEIDIVDDGGGIDPLRIKSIAVKKGVISEEEAEQMTDHQAVNLIFAPGFSTAEEVSDISGRGVGMDVVMSNIRKIQGTVDVNSKLGEGTQVRLKLPLTLAVIDALIIGVHQHIYAVPLDAVKETVQIQKSNLKTLKEKLALDLRGEILGVTPLTELLYLDSDSEETKINEDEDSSKISIVVLQVNGREIGIAVDRLFNQQEVVVKPLEDYLAAIPGLKGSTIMGDGQVVLILEPNELMELASTT